MISQIPRLVRKLVRLVIPKPVLDGLERLRATQPIAERRCPVCNFSGYFGLAGFPPRIDALCPTCGSLERHRLFWLWFSDNKSLQSPVLHFAAEKMLSDRLQGCFEEYSTADLHADADLQLNIEDIKLRSESQGSVICNHVLEHVDDQKALSELYRILVTGGSLVVTVPLVEGWDSTYENDNITDPALRVLHFGQSDHLRMYGADFRERVRSVGFMIEEEYVGRGPQVVDYGLTRGERIFICRKLG
ncbi:methyltransferase domain-containing protein [Kineobactrum salinum]|uniref:Methyltransferase domain-containing protein n=1 Tax=Kineobactrum salinum TaxID=2708301 RepID=A0A6C0U416_9GAMM|nr:methyltransferase domain-containing protein [Kineobactrum salinum]QIB66159.1 methyltransferase domain-containing protein [Kineobactrum salinum]